MPRPSIPNDKVHAPDAVPGHPDHDFALILSGGNALGAY